jgi:VanZ family protein
MWLVVSLTLTATILVLTLLRGDVWIVRATPRPLQKLLHFLFYAGLAISLLATQSSYGLNQRIAVLLTVALAIGFGATLEWLQTLRPGRTARVADIARDAAGVILGVAIWLVTHL